MQTRLGHRPGHGPARDNASDYLRRSRCLCHRHGPWLFPGSMEELAQVQQGVHTAAPWENLSQCVSVRRHGREFWELWPFERVLRRLLEVLLGSAQSAGAVSLCPAPSHDDGRNGFADNDQQLRHRHFPVSAAQAGFVEALADDAFELGEHDDVQGLQHPRRATRHDEDPDAGVAESLARCRSYTSSRGRRRARALRALYGRARAGWPARHRAPSGTEPYPR